MRTVVFFGPILVIAAWTHAAVAAEVNPARSLPGYVCMMLRETPQQAVDPRFRVPLRTQPMAGAAIAGNAMPVVAVKAPLQAINGFYETLFPNGTRVWIASAMVLPYHSLGDPSAKCRPVVMSNGLIGFEYYH